MDFQLVTKLTCFNIYRIEVLQIIIVHFKSFVWNASELFQALVTKIDYADRFLMDLDFNGIICARDLVAWLKFSRFPARFNPRHERLLNMNPENQIWNFTRFLSQVHSGSPRSGLCPQGCRFIQNAYIGNGFDYFGYHLGLQPGTWQERVSLLTSLDFYNLHWCLHAVLHVPDREAQCVTGFMHFGFQTELI